MIKSTLIASAALPVLMYTSALAQDTRAFPEGTTLIEVQAECAGQSIVKIDGLYNCLPQASDSLGKIILDMEKSDVADNPISAGNEGDRSALRLLPSATRQSQQTSTAKVRALLGRLDALDVSNLKGDNKLNYDLLKFALGQRLLRSDFDESRVPFTNDSGFFSSMSFIVRQTKFESVDDFEAYAARLSELPRYFGEIKDNMRRGVKTNYTAADDIIPGIIEIIRALTVDNPAEHELFAPFKSFPDNISEEDQTRLKALGLQTMNTHVKSAYGDMLSFMEDEYAPHARKSAGIGPSEEMRTYYRALVKHFTTLDVTPDEVHQIGLDEVSRIRGEMDAVIAKTEFEGSFIEFLDFLRTDKQFYVDTPEQLMKEAAWIAKRIDGVMPAYFGKLPRLSYGVMEVPASIAPTYTTGRYWGGSPANGQAGNYMVNTYNLKQRPLYNLPALTLHEGVPGHHHQISLGQELEDVPKFRRDLYPNVFGEGWGLYAEKLGVEMGIYQTPYEDFGRLTYEMWRACRLVVDTGMHWKGWTREQAEACFFENSALAPHNIRTEVDRYISWPGQALAYKIGELKIWELRKKAENELGEDFDLRAFHDAVLSNGGVPLGILEQQVGEWIKGQKSGD